MKKFISALLTVAMLLVCVPSAFAAVSLQEMEGYVVLDPSTIPAASVYDSITPTLTVTPTPIEDQSVLKSLTTNMWGNNTRWANNDFYRVDFTLSGLGELVNGKDENEDRYYVGLYAIKAFLPGIDVSTAFSEKHFKDNQISGNTTSFSNNTAGTGANFLWTSPTLSNPYPIFDSSADPFVTQYMADGSVSWYVVLGLTKDSSLTISDIDASVTYTHSVAGRNIERHAAPQSVTLAKTPTTYTVTYYDENGSTPALQTTANLSSGAATPAAPAYTPAAGYQLDGWSTTQGGAVASIPATVSANADYFAVVSQIDYTVTFMNGESEVSKKTDYHYGDTLVAPADPSKAGFTFSGWSTSPSGAVADLPETVTGGATYYAQFVEDGPSLPADIERKAGRAISKFTTADGALPTLKPGQTATVETDADYYITEFDTKALKFAEYDYAIKATADDESYMVFDKIDGANLAEVAGNINFFVIVKKVTDRAHEIVNIVVKAFEK